MSVYTEILKVLRDDLLPDLLTEYHITNNQTGMVQTEPAIRVRNAYSSLAVTYSIPEFDFTGMNQSEKEAIPGVECVIENVPDSSPKIERLGLFGGILLTRYYSITCYQHNYYAPLDQVIEILSVYDGLFYVREMMVAPLRRQQGTKQGIDPAEVTFRVYFR